MVNTDTEAAGTAPPRLPSRQALDTIRAHVWLAAGFSVVINLLFLVSPLYMLQIYDRVLASGSGDTLILLTLIAVFLLGFYIAADGARKRVLARAGQALGAVLDEVTLRRGLAGGQPSQATMEAVGNLSRVQNLLSQGTLAPLFDIPFAPLFLGILFVIHPVLGAVGLAGTAILIALALISDRVSRRPTQEAGDADGRASQFLATMIRQRAAIVSLGMAGRLTGRWKGLRGEASTAGFMAGGAAGYLASTARAVRQMLQVAILGAAAALAIAGHVSPGSIVAGSIIMGRGLAPIDQLVALWRTLVVGRKSWRELAAWVDAGAIPDAAPAVPMPRPAPQLGFEEFSVGLPGADKPLLPQVTFELERGAVVALLGPSGAGKTTFLQCVAGAWDPFHGMVRLGARQLNTWDPDDRGRFIGYLPQRGDLLPGTVFQNIARFTDPDPEKVFRAARQIGCHEMILSLPQGYETRIGEGQTHLSSGQRQGVGLARAFFGRPACLLLDEPTAHLDAALSARFVEGVKRLAGVPQAERPVTAIIATHDQRIVNLADTVIIIQDRKIAVTSGSDYLEKVARLREATDAPGRSGNAVEASS